MAQLSELSEDRRRTRLQRALAFAVAILALAATATVASQPYTPATLLPGPWGEMREESPARPLADAGDAAIRLRQQHMRAVSSQYRSVEALAMAETPLAPMSLAAARTLHELAERNTALFAPAVPRRTRFGAKAAIWQEPAEFAEHVAGFTLATSRLLQAIENSEAESVGAGLAAVRHQCLACHFHYAYWENRPGVEGRRVAARP
jgi:cytochrome c556